MYAAWELILTSWVGSFGTFQNMPSIPWVLYLCFQTRPPLLHTHLADQPSYAHVRVLVHGGIHCMFQKRRKRAISTLQGVSACRLRFHEGSVRRFGKRGSWRQTCMAVRGVLLVLGTHMKCQIAVFGAGEARDSMAKPYWSFLDTRGKCRVWWREGSWREKEEFIYVVEIERWTWKTSLEPLTPYHC
jgi:hypothetical protein